MNHAPAPGDIVEGRDFLDLDWAETDVTDAVFRDCRFENVRFINVTLAGARFERCRLIASRFAHADARETEFDACVFSRPQDHAGVQIAFSRFDSARFSRCDLAFARLERSDLHGISLEDCDLRGAVIERCEFRRRLGRALSEPRANFIRCNMHFVELAGAVLRDCDLTGCRMLEANLSAADLEGTDLRGCELFGANLAGAKLARADLRDAEISGLDLTHLASRDGLIIAPAQQHLLLAAMGVDVRID